MSRFTAVTVALILSAGGAVAESQAQEQPVMESAVAVEADPAAIPAEAYIAPKSKSPRGKRIREKEAEGTQAPNRFEADTVIKSKYQADGQPLEVDPD